ncbi:MAG: SGNH/GDSL hydrolase family protein [Bacteroidota bacterium]
MEEISILNASTSVTYLALGDSYTIGEAVNPSESFPYQLITLLQEKGVEVEEPIVIAKTGWTTNELKVAIEAAELKETFGLVTLLIGVNNQYRSYTLESYSREFKELLQIAINFAGGNKAHVFVISIPDWGVTPFGKTSGRDVLAISQEIDAFNDIKKAETLAMGVSYIDITPESRNVITDLSLLADDGLHYSGKMYAELALRLSAKIVTSL